MPEVAMPVEPPMFFTQEQLMARYQISRSTLVRLRVTALPTPVRIGSAPRWRLADLVKWEDAGCPENALSPKTKAVFDAYEAAHPGSTTEGEADR